jgi:NAD-dependent SIR2 family protein deacetylase
MIKTELLRDLDSKSESAFIQLLKELMQKKVTLFLGAGVSASSGIPTWNKLIEQICSTFFYHWEFSEKEGTDKIPKNLSIAFWEDFMWSDDALLLSKTLSRENPINVAEQIKSRIRPIDWMYLIRKLLYHQNELKPSKLLNEIALLFSTEFICKVLTSNYDDLLEQQMKTNGIKCKSIVFEPFKKSSEKVVIHAHGMLPILGGRKTRIIFTESEYNEEFSKPYSWTNIVQLNEFNQATCLFIGTSFTDINFIKLLRVSREHTTNMHYAFIFNDKSKDNKIKELFYHYLYDLGINAIIIPMKDDSDFSELPNYIRLINDFLNNMNHELRNYTN